MHGSDYYPGLDGTHDCFALGSLSINTTRLRWHSRCQLCAGILGSGVYIVVLWSLQTFLPARQPCGYRHFAYSYSCYICIIFHFAYCFLCPLPMAFFDLVSFICYFLVSYLCLLLHVFTCSSWFPKGLHIRGVLVYLF